MDIGTLTCSTPLGACVPTLASAPGTVILALTLGATPVSVLNVTVGVFTGYPSMDSYPVTITLL